MRRRALAAAAAAVVALALLPAAPAAAAAPEAALVVAPRDGGVLRGGDLVVDVTVTNTGNAELPAGTLAFSIEQQPVASTTALLDALASPSAQPLGLLTRTSRRTPPLAPRASATVTARIDRDDVRSILGRAPASGARLLYAQLQADGLRSVVAKSVVTRMAKDPRGNLGLGTVIPLTAPANTTGVVDVERQAGLTAPDGAWASALEAARAMPSAAVALDPEVIASIRLAGDDAPPAAVRFLDDLATLPNPMLRLPYADADAALSRAATGSTALAGPSSFAGSSAATVGGGPVPSPTASSSDQDDRTVAALTAWHWSTQRVVWPVPRTTTPADLRAAGSDDTVLLGGGDVRDGPARVAAGPGARVGGARALIVDPQASALLRRAAARGPDGQAAVAPLVALLATHVVGRTAPALLTTVGRDSDLRALPAVLRLLSDLPWIDGRRLDQLAGTAATDVALRPGADPGARVSTARSLLAGERAVRDLGRALQDPDAVTGPPRLARLALLSAAWRGQPDAAWRAAVAGATTGYRAVIGKVHIARGAQTTPIGTDGSLRVLVQNELPSAVSVEVRATVSNGRLRFTTDRSQRIVVPAGAGKNADLAFRSINNGPTTVALRLTTPSGAALGPPSYRDVMVRAGFDTVVAVVLLALLGALLALGVHRNVRRRPRARMAAA